MQLYLNPAPSTYKTLLKRPALDLTELEKPVRDILDQVKYGGDAALLRFTEQFDRVRLTNLKTPETELAGAEAELTPELVAAIRQAHQNIKTFHQHQLQPIVEVETMPGVRCWRKQVGIQKVGLYVPGGTAPLFSSVLMLAVPAKIAGCQEIVLCTPPQENGRVHPAIRFAAHLCGVNRVFAVGGAQAVGAMAYGTETIPSVYKIFGPGNAYVNVAKQLVNRSGTAIDMPAGPSEVMVCADDTANPHFVAADLLSQAEHGPDSQVVLVCFSEGFAHTVKDAVRDQVATLPRREFAKLSLQNSSIIVVDTLTQAVEAIDAYAPEHLLLAVEDARALGERITNAGSVFLGNYTPESVGDYASGTNHTLPTNGYARTYSGASVDSFVRQITFQELSTEGLRTIAPTVEAMASAEHLEAHRRAVSIRLETLKSGS